MGSSTGVRHERQEDSSTESLRVEGFFFLVNLFGIDARMIYFRENSNETDFFYVI